jgi:hypothetical protein
MWHKSAVISSNGFPHQFFLPERQRELPNLWNENGDIHDKYPSRIKVVIRPPPKAFRFTVNLEQAAFPASGF